MKINNEQLTQLETKWITNMLSEDIPQYNLYVSQINHSRITREGNGFFISILFEVDHSISQINMPVIPQINMPVRVPIEMYLRKEGEAPIAFLLHIIGGYITELEIYRVDSSIVSPNILIQNYRKEVVYYWN